MLEDGRGLIISIVVVVAGTIALGSAPTPHPNMCATLGAQKLAVILATYPGAPSDSAAPNADYIQSLFTGTAQGFSVVDYYKTVSNQKTYFQSVAVLGPYTTTKPFVIDLSKDPNNLYTGLDQWERDLLALASKDINLMNIDRVMFITPEAIDPQGQPVSMTTGISSQGICDLDYAGSEGSRTFAHSWVRAGTNYLGAAPHEKLQMMRDLAPLIHELGHTFNLGHANQVNRPEKGMTSPANDEVLPSANQNLYEVEFGDPFSVMSSDQIGWFSVPHLSQLGWLNDDEIQEVNSDGVYRIYPLEKTPGTPDQLRGLKIPRALNNPVTDSNASIWVEYRQDLTPYDTDLSGLNHSLKGALVHYTNPDQPMPLNYYPNETILLNFVPSGLVSPFQTDLTLKGTWKDPHSLVELRVTNVTPQHLDIEVEFTK